MNTKDKLKVMFQMQDEMNIKAAGADWKEQDLPWWRAAYMEAAELNDHLGYKWWKKQEPDLEQAQMEVVDIWHFVLSARLCNWNSNHVDNAAYDLSIHAYEHIDIYDKEGILTLVEALMARALDYKYIDIELLIKIHCALGLTFDDVYRLYVGKNILNHFRQDNGYKDDTYVKVWNDLEDNEVMRKIVDELDVDSEAFKDDVYTALQETYLEVLEN